MALQPNTKYNETKVLNAYMTESTKKGTSGLFFLLDTQTDDGRAEHTAWITPGTVERLKEDLYECFGITAQELMDVAFLEKIGERMRGDIVSITTDEGGEYGVKVKWMNPSGFRAKKVEPAKLKRIAGIFGGGPVSSPAYRNEPHPFAPIDNEDAPF